jgi:hypothetical protein
MKEAPVNDKAAITAQYLAVEKCGLKAGQERAI